MKIGIMAAMPDEVNTIHDHIDFHRSETHGERTYYLGKYFGIDLVLVCSRCGKVSAAATATSLIEKYRVDRILFTGLAGAVSPHLKIGDVILGEKSYQHDMDARPIFPRFEIPLTGYSLFQSDVAISKLVSEAIQRFISNIYSYISPNVLKKFNISTPKFYAGTIATGDQFIKDPLHHDGLKFIGENVLAVEMEGAAVGQVCQEYKLPFVLIRTISDKADHSASIDFRAFIAEIAGHYASGIIREFLAKIQQTVPLGSVKVTT